MALDHLFATVSSTPAVQDLRQRMEGGEPCTVAGISPGAQPFLVALLRRLFPQRPIVAVLEGVKAQEGFHQDVATWFKLQEPPSSPQRGSDSEATAKQSAPPPPLFYPDWEILPHESKLPHADIISERLETLLTLAQAHTANPAPTIVTNVIALLQRTFAPEVLAQRMRRVRNGDRLDPLVFAE